MCYISAPIADEGLLKSVGVEGQLLETVFGKSTFLKFMRIFQKPKVFCFQGVSEVDIGKE